MKIRISLIALIIGSYAIFSMPLYAQIHKDAPPLQSKYGLSIISSDISPGVDNIQTNIFPYIDAIYDDFFIINVEKGVGFQLVNYQKNWFKSVLGTTMWYEIGRDADDEEKFRGVELDPSLEARIFSELELGPAEIGLELVKGLTDGGYEGTYFEVTSALLGVKNPNWPISIGIGPYARWGDSRYIQRLYGVDRVQAANSTYEQFSPSAGIEQLGWEARLTWEIEDAYEVLLKVKSGELDDRLVQSPYIEQSETFWAGLVVAKLF